MACWTLHWSRSMIFPLKFISPFGAFSHCHVYVYVYIYIHVELVLFTMLFRGNNGFYHELEGFVNFQANPLKLGKSQTAVFSFGDLPVGTPWNTKSFSTTKMGASQQLVYGLYLVYIWLYQLYIYIYLDVHPRHWIRGCLLCLLRYCSKHRLDVLPICQEVLPFGNLTWLLKITMFNR